MVRYRLVAQVDAAINEWWNRRRGERRLLTKLTIGNQINV